MNYKLLVLLFLLTGLASLCFAQVVTLSVDTQILAGNAPQGTLKQAIYHFHLTRDNANTGTLNLTDINFTTTGSYASTDVAVFQLWTNTTDAISSATQISTDITSSLGTGSHSFASFTQALSRNSIRYFWITTDITVNAVTTNTLNVVAWTTSNFTISAGTKSGSAIAGGAQTITTFASATTDYFRSYTSGNWATAGTWESSHDNSGWRVATLSPTNAANVITILNGHTVTVGANVSTDQTTIDSGGEIDVSSGITLTIANGADTYDMIVDGTLRNNAGTITTTGALSFGSGGKYQSNFTTAVGLIPTATWNATSNCEIIGYTSFAGNQTGLGQTFGNFKWNCPAQTGNINANSLLTFVAGDLTIAATNTGSFRLTATGTPTLALGGDLIINGGTLDMSSGVGGTSIINLSGNFTMSGGTLTESGTGTNNINFAGTTNQVISITNSPTISNTLNFTVNSNAIAEFETDTTILGGSGGTFSASSGSTLIIKHASGITSAGLVGCIQTTGTRTFNTGANYTYIGTATQVTGNGIPATVNSLTLNNATGLTLSKSVVVTTTFTQTAGDLAVGPFTLTINGTGKLNASDIINGAGGFVLASAATLQIANVEGIAASGATGSVQTTTRTFNTGANYTYNGTSSQITGSGLPATVNNLIINNALGVDLTNSCAITAALTLTTGLTIGPNTLTINGTIPTVSGGLVGGSTSNIVIGGSAALVLPAITSGLHDLTINRTSGVTLGNSLPIGGTCTFTVGNMAVGSYSLTIDGTVIFAAAPVITGAGSFILSSGASLTTANAAGITSSGATGSVQTTTRTFNTGADYTYNGSVTQATGTGLPTTVHNFTLNNTSGNSTTLTSSCTVTNIFTITSGNMTCTSPNVLMANGTAIFNAANYVSGTGTFTLASGATLITANLSGLVTGTSSGSVRTTTKNFNTAANYTYNGAGAQATGTALPTTVNDLTINNASGVTLSASCAVNGTYTMTSGNVAVGAFILTVNGVALFNATNIVSGAGSFVLASGGTIQTPNTAGIMASGATGSVQTTTRTFNVGANYTYTGTSAQATGTGYPTFCTGILNVNTSIGIILTLSAARTLGTNGKISLTSGIFAASTFLTMGTGSSITRIDGTMTGTIQGATAYAVIYNGNSKTTGNELSGSGLGNITIDLSNAANTITLDRSITIDNLETLVFIQGTVTLANFNIIMNGNYTGTNLFIYNGTGTLGGGNVGANANVLVQVATPNAIPSIVNTLDVSPGVGNTVLLPGDVTTTTLTFSNGSLGLHNHILTMAGQDFALTGSSSLSALSVTLYNEAHTYESSTSLAHTWQTNGTLSGSVSIIFSYPPALTSALQLSIWKRNHIVGESGWDYVQILPTLNHSVTLDNVTNLNGSVKGDLDWTIALPNEELPVELTSFTAALSQTTFVTVQWTTQSETNEVGYNIFRNNVEDLSTAIKVNANMISATNTSITHTYFFRDMIVTNDDTYYYWLSDITNNNVETFHGPAMVSLGNNGNITPPPNIPLVTSVQSIFPNPFTPSATITYGVKERGMVRINVYNTRGQVVRTLLSEDKNPNNYRTIWDGKDMNGRTCASGVYVVELVSGKVKSTMKAILMK